MPPLSIIPRDSRVKVVILGGSPTPIEAWIKNFRNCSSVAGLKSFFSLIEKGVVSKGHGLPVLCELKRIFDSIRDHSNNNISGLVTKTPYINAQAALNNTILAALEELPSSPIGEDLFAVQDLAGLKNPNDQALSAAAKNKLNPGAQPTSAANGASAPLPTTTISISHTIPEKIEAGKRSNIKIFAKDGSDLRNIKGYAVSSDYTKTIQIKELTHPTANPDKCVNINLRIEAHAPAGDLRIDLFADEAKTQPIGYFTVPLEAPKQEFFTVTDGPMADHSFIVENRLGQGGMGEVFKVKDADGKIFIAKRPLNTEPDTLDRFYREIQNMEKSRDTNVTGVMDYFGKGETKGPDGVKLPFFIAEFVEFSLKDIIEGNDLDIKTKLDIFRQLVEALGDLYDKATIAHRDLCPDNVRITKINGHYVVKLADMGQARQIYNKDGTALGVKQTVTQDGQFVAKFNWLCPDVILFGGWGNLEKADKNFPRFADIYTLGLIWYFMLANSQDTKGSLKYLYMIPPFPKVGENKRENEKNLREWKQAMEKNFARLAESSDLSTSFARIPDSIAKEITFLFKNTLTLDNKKRADYPALLEKIKQASAKLATSDLSQVIELSTGMIIAETNFPAVPVGPSETVLIGPNAAGGPTSLLPGEYDLVEDLPPLDIPSGPPISLPPQDIKSVPPVLSDFSREFMAGNYGQDQLSVPPAPASPNLSGSVVSQALRGDSDPGLRPPIGKSEVLDAEAAGAVEETGTYDKTISALQQTLAAKTRELADLQTQLAALKVQLATPKPVDPLDKIMADRFQSVGPTTVIADRQAALNALYLAHAAVFRIDTTNDEIDKASDLATAALSIDDENITNLAGLVIAKASKRRA